MEFFLILFLIFLNGFFAMAEIAIVASRKSKLQQMISKGNKSAEAALALAQNPAKFFPTIQIGITLISILAGAIGITTLAAPFSEAIKQIPILGVYHGILSFIMVIGGITYISLVIGELVPKHVAISNPEKISVFVAPFMQGLLKVALPLVGLLSVSSEFVLKLLGVKRIPASTSVSEDEIRLLMSEGTRAGIFNLIENRLVDKVLHLDELRVDSLMTPRETIQWFDINRFPENFKIYLSQQEHSRIVLCDKTIDNLVGVIHVKDFLRHYVSNSTADIKKRCQKPHLIPENTSAIKALELFRKSPVHIALITDESGAVRGLVTFNDVLEAVIGNIQEGIS